MSGKIKVALLVMAVFIISAIVSFVTMVEVGGRSDKVFPGVTVNGISLGGKTRDQAGQALLGYEQSLKDETVTTSFNGGSGSFNLSDIGLQLKTKEMIDEALLVGRSGSFLEQWRERRDIAEQGKDFPLKYVISKDKLQIVLDDLTKNIRIPPKDAKLVITPQETVEIVESAYGVGVDADDAFDKVNNIIENGLDPEFEVSLIALEPSQSTDDIRNLRVNGVIASFTTRFDINKTNRVYNIKVAASALDGQMIMPGESFSFNKVVGPRSQESGYKLAPTILNNEFVDSLGGGVCQVSTTLYNSLLGADVQILERSNHSLTIGYVPLGQDAAVAYGGKDLKFKNNLPGALVIKSVVSGNTVTFKLFGDISLRKSINVTNNVIKEYPFKTVYKDDPTLDKGKQVVKQKGTKGYRVTSQMVVYQGGTAIATKTLPSSYYKPLDQVILVGTKPVANKPTSGSDTPPGNETTPSSGGTETPPSDEPQPPVEPPAEPPVTHETPLLPPDPEA